MSHKIIVRILGDVGSGKSAAYCRIASLLKDSGATVLHADEKAWTALQNAGEAAAASENLYQFSPEVTMEEAVIRTDATLSKNQIMQFFAYSHLPPHLQRVSRPFALLAQEMDQNMPDGPEKSTGLRKLLESKDCMVRAVIAK